MYYFLSLIHFFTVFWFMVQKWQNLQYKWKKRNKQNYATNYAALGVQSQEKEGIPSGYIKLPLASNTYLICACKRYLLAPKYNTIVLSGYIWKMCCLKNKKMYLHCALISESVCQCEVRKRALFSRSETFRPFSYWISAPPSYFHSLMKLSIFLMPLLGRGNEC